MTPQFRLCRSKVQHQRLPAAVAPDDPAPGPGGFDVTVVRVPPGEIKRHRLSQRQVQAGGQHPGQVGVAGAGNEGRRSWKSHARLIDFDLGGADARTNKWAEWGRAWAHPLP